jgi:hypothetical protein
MTFKYITSEIREGCQPSLPAPPTVGTGAGWQALQKVPPFAGFGKEGWGRFSEEYVFSIMDSLVIVKYVCNIHLFWTFWK